MRKILMSMFFIFLMVSMPMSLAAESFQSDFEEYDTGESIVVNVRSYEPTILTSNLLFDTDVPVYAYLGGTSVGQILGSNIATEPIYGGISIDKVKVKPADAETADFLRGDISYKRPNKITDETLGYLQMNLKQLDANDLDTCDSDAECDAGYQCDLVCVPETISLNLSAEIWFSEAQRLYSLAQTSLVLPVDKDESDWEASLEELGAFYSFYGGRGLIRVRDISSDTVSFTVYSNKDLYYPIIGAPRSISDQSLKKGETSNYIDLGFTDEQILGDARFRVKVVDIKDPAEERAVLLVNVNGQQSQMIVTEGSALYPGSSWKVRSISVGESGRSGIEHVIVLQDSKGNLETITTSLGGGLNEEASDLLNKKFYKDTEESSLSSSEKENAMFFTSSSKSIPSFELYQLGDAFRVYGVNIDTSEVDDERVKTKKVTLDSGMTLKQALITLLPAGYYYSVPEPNVVQIREFTSTNPCTDVEIFHPGGLPDTVNKEDNKLLRSLYCTSIAEYQQVIDEYDGEIDPASGDSLADLGYLGIATSYESMASQMQRNLSQEEYQGAIEQQLNAYQALVDRGSDVVKGVNVQDRANELQNQITGDITYGSATVDDNGKFVYVKLVSVDQLAVDALSSVEISKDGLTSTYSKGDLLFSSSFTTDNGYNWEVNKIEDGYVRFKKVYTTTNTALLGNSETISLGNSENIDGSTIRIKEINTKKEAHLLIIPGTGDSLRSVSNFSVHIPIETRSIPLNPEKIDDRIERAKKVQEKISQITDTLDKVVEYWNYACLGVFALVSLRSSFLSSSAEARHDVIHGYDDQSGWNAYCHENSGFGAGLPYISYDECMQANAAAIELDIAAAQQAKDTAESFGGNYNGQVWYDSMVTEYVDREGCQELLGDDVFLDEASLQELAYLNTLSGTTSSQVDSSVNSALAGYSSTSTSLSLQSAKAAACNNVSVAIINNADLAKITDPVEQDVLAKRIAGGVYESSLILGTSGSAELPEAKGFPTLSTEVLGASLVSVGKVFKGKTSRVSTVYTTSGSVDVEPLTINLYEDVLLHVNSTTSDPAALAQANDDIEKIAKIDPRDKDDPIVATNGESYYITDGWDRKSATYTIYIGTLAYSTAALSEQYAAGAKFEVYGSGEYRGLPYCVPYSDGNFVKILSYTKNLEADEVQFWNVGPDGELCSADDILVSHQSQLAYLSANPSLITLVNFVNKYIKDDLVEGQKINIAGHEFTVSYGKSRIILEGASSSCYDVMDPSDCKLLFNTCDPVMCPPSRFNLNGRWQVDNVVESGFIGSLILGQGTGDAVPVCLTGVLSSMTWMDSMMEGYVECLEAAKFEGETVGVCDKVRSVFMCELFVREAAAIMDYNNGGILDFLGEKFYGREGGGGEYFHFKENLQNMQNAVTYFTTDYASTAFAAFKGRSFEEYGSEICKQALYARTPWFEDFMHQITTPEDPNQFYATMTVKPYSPTNGLAAYQTYYHIYAGVNENIDRIVYSVYLRNSQNNDRYYTTETCDVSISKTIELGEMVDVTQDCIAPEGFDEVCVVINGETHCGFGSVTTSFAVDFLKDSLVADEVQRTIESENECYPSVSTASPSVSQVGSVGVTESLVLPYDFGILQTGVRRVCSIENPARGQGNTGDWVIVGTCGEDEEGRPLGSCWLDTESYTIHDALKNQNTSTYLEEVNWEESQKLLGLDDSDLWDARESDERYVALLSQLSEGTKCGADGTLGTLQTLPEEFELLETRTDTFQYAALARFSLAGIYTEVVEQCEIVGRATINYQVMFNGERVYPSSQGVVTVSKDTNTLEVNVKDLLDGDTVTLDGRDCEKNPDGSHTCEATVVDGQSFTLQVKNHEGEELLSKTLTVSVDEKKEEVEERETSDDDLAGKAVACDQVCSFLDLWNCENSCAVSSNICYYTDGGLAGLSKCLDCEKVYEDKKEEIDKAENKDERVALAEEMCNELNDDRNRCENYYCAQEFISPLSDVNGVCFWDDVSSTCKFKDTGYALPVDPSDVAVGTVVLKSAEELEQVMTSTNNDHCSAYADWIYEYANKHDVDALLLFTMMRRESNCNPDAEGPTGDFGLMQITEPTWETSCKDDLRQSSFNDIKGSKNAEANIECGALILRDKYNSAVSGYPDGRTFTCQDPDVVYKDWELALRYYNGWIGDSKCEDNKALWYYVEGVLEEYGPYAEALATIQGVSVSTGETTTLTSAYENYLLIGASHTVGEYGAKLQELLIETNGVEHVHTSAVSGSSAVHWISGSFGGLDYGAVLRDDEKETLIDGEVGGAISTFEDEITNARPDVIIISLGTNSLPSVASTTVYEDQMAALAKQKADVCYWVGPAVVSEAYEHHLNLDATSDNIKRAVESDCIYIDARIFTDVNKLSSDGLHFSTEGSHEMAEGVYDSLKALGAIS